MASSSSSPSPKPHTPSPTFPPTTPIHTGLDPNSSHPNTTFVHADPSTFRAVVQKLTGAPGDVGRRKSAFKLHERRPTHARINLDNIKLNNNNNNYMNDGTYGTNTTPTLHSPNNSSCSAMKNHMTMVSPVSPLEYIAAARGSPTTPRSPLQEEERAIADKGFYLHPSPLSTPRGSDPPELLPLFPLHSPRDHY